MPSLRGFDNNRTTITRQAAKWRRRAVTPRGSQGPRKRVPRVEFKRRATASSRTVRPMIPASATAADAVPLLLGIVCHEPGILLHPRDDLVALLVHAACGNGWARGTLLTGRKALQTCAGYMPGALQRN